MMFKKDEKPVLESLVREGFEDMGQTFGDLMMFKKNSYRVLYNLKEDKEHGRYDFNETAVLQE